MLAPSELCCDEDLSLPCSVGEPIEAVGPVTSNGDNAISSGVELLPSFVAGLRLFERWAGPWLKMGALEALDDELFKEVALPKEQWDLRSEVPVCLSGPAEPIEVLLAVVSSGFLLLACRPSSFMTIGSSLTGVADVVLSSDVVRSIAPADDILEVVN